MGWSQLSIVLAQIRDIYMAFGGNFGHGHQHQPQLQQDMNSDMALSSNPGQDVTMASAGSPGHSNQFDPWRQYSPQTSI